MTRLRVAAFTPGSPGTTGAASYAGGLLPALTAHCDITAFDVVPASWRIPTHHPRAYRREDFDVSLFFVGNSVDCLTANEAAAQIPGVTVWHDVTLQGIMDVTAPLTVHDTLERRFGPGRAARLSRLWDAGQRSEWDFVLFPLVDRQLRTTTAAVVHSEFTGHLITAERPDLPVHHVRMHHGDIQPDLEARHVRRAALGIGDDEWVAGVAGHFATNRRPREAVAGLRQARHMLERRGRRVRVLLIGAVAGDHQLAALLTRAGLDDITVRAAELEHRDFLATLRAADVLVHLRHPTVGSSSMLVAQAQRLGVPVITSAAGSMAELRGVRHVGVGDAEVADLAHAIVALASDASARARLAAAGRAEARAAAPERVAEAYAAVLETVPHERREHRADVPSPTPARTLRDSSLRIAICAPQLPLASGGLERLCQELWRNLRDRGHAADLVRMPATFHSRTAIIRSMALWRMSELDAPAGFDVVIPTAFPSYAVRHPCKVTWLVAQHRFIYDLADSKYATVWHRSSQWRDAMIRADRVALAESRALFAISSNVAARLRAYNKLEARVLHPPPPVVREPSDRFGDFVLSVGRVDSLKRHMLLTEAIARLDVPGRCIIVGTGNEMDELLDCVEREHAHDRVTVAGWVDDDELRRLYAEARAIFYGPLDEDLGLVTLEAFAAGKPVVTLSDSGGVLEFVDDGVSGWVAEPDAEHLAEALREVFRDDAACATRGREGLARVANMSWERVIDSLLQDC